MDGSLTKAFAMPLTIPWILQSHTVLRSCSQLILSGPVAPLTRNLQASNLIATLHAAPTRAHPTSTTAISLPIYYWQTASFTTCGPSACSWQVLLVTTPASSPGVLPRTLRERICKTSFSILFFWTAHAQFVLREASILKLSPFHMCRDPGVLNCLNSAFVTFLLLCNPFPSCLPHYLGPSIASPACTKVSGWMGGWCREKVEHTEMLVFSSALGGTANIC